MAEAPYSISPILSVATNLLIQLWSHCVQGILPEISLCCFILMGAAFTQSMWVPNFQLKLPLGWRNHFVRLYRNLVADDRLYGLPAFRVWCTFDIINLVMAPSVENTSIVLVGRRFKETFTNVFSPLIFFRNHFERSC